MKTLAIVSFHLHKSVVFNSFQPDDKSQPSANVIVVLYSITDRGSFHVAREILQSIRANGSTDPILLLANKSDLSHLRQVRHVAAAASCV